MYSVVCVLYLLWVVCVGCDDGLFESVGTTFVGGCDAVVLCMTYYRIVTWCVWRALSGNSLLGISWGIPFRLLV